MPENSGSLCIFNLNSLCMCIMIKLKLINIILPSVLELGLNTAH